MKRKTEEMHLTYHPLFKSPESSGMQEWLYVAPTPNRSHEIASWKDPPHRAYNDRLHKWAHVLLLLMAIAVVTVLGGIGLSTLYQEGGQLSSDEPTDADVGSDPHLEELLQAHRNAVLRRCSVGVMSGTTRRPLCMESAAVERSPAANSSPH